MKNIRKSLSGLLLACAVLITFNVDSFARTTKALKGDEALPSSNGTINKAKYVDNNNGSFERKGEKLSLRGDDAIHQKDSDKFGDTKLILHLTKGLATVDVVENDARPFHPDNKKKAAATNIVINLLRQLLIVDNYEDDYYGFLPVIEPVYFPKTKSGKFKNID